MLSSASKVLEDSARGSFYLTLGNVISVVVSALSLILIARLLGSEQYGLYTISTIVPSLVLVFVDPGMSQGIMKYSASLRVKGDEKRLGKLLLHGLSFEAIAGLAAFTMCFAFSDQLANYVLNRPDIGGLIRIASALVIFQTLITALNAAFVGLDKTEHTALATVVQAVAKALISLALLVSGFGILGALVGYVSSIIFACLLGILLFIFNIYRSFNRSNDNSGRFWANLKMLVSYGLPLYASVLIGGFTIQYRNILLSLFASNYEVGNFQAAQNFNMIVNSISVPIATMLLPAFSKIEEKKETVKDFFRMSLKYNSMVILPFAILLIVYSKEAVQIIYGDGYELAPYLLSMYSLTYLLVGLGFNTLGSFFGGLGETRTNLKITLVSSVMMILLAPMLTSSLKAIGIVLTILISSLAGILYGLHMAEKTYEIETDRRTIARIYMVSFASALPLLLLEVMTIHSPILKVLVGTSVYFAFYLLLTPLFRIIKPSELAEVRRVLDKTKPLKYITRPILRFEEMIMRRFLFAD